MAGVFLPTLEIASGWQELARGEANAAVAWAATVALSAVLGIWLMAALLVSASYFATRNLVHRWLEPPPEDQLAPRPAWQSQPTLPVNTVRVAG